MQLILAGLGSGAEKAQTIAVKEAIQEADYLIGAPRLLESLDSEAPKIPLISSQEILEWILAHKDARQPVVLFSGDSGFYSGTQGLGTLLKAQQIDFQVLPGISSVQLLSAALHRPWQDWKLVSAHGTNCDILSALSQTSPTFFLTGGKQSSSKELCLHLSEAGLGALQVTVGEKLGTEEEALHQGSAEELSHKDFASLSVLLAEAVNSLADTAPEALMKRSPGWPDAAFIRGEVPMTKQEVRASVLAKLGIRPGEVVWDIGAGTGSVSVEMALLGSEVYAVEVNPDACELILKNKEKFHATGLKLIKGRAPEALEELPAPDAVFLGGTKGSMKPILDLVLGKNPEARICISAIALETLHAAISEFTERGIEAEVTQIAVSRTKSVQGLHLLMANNPTFLITGNCV